MSYTQQEKEDALKRKDLSKLTNMINDGVDVNSLFIAKHTDILLEAINKDRLLFLHRVLDSGFKCKNNSGFCYVHHAIRTHKKDFVEVIVSQYKKEDININEYSVDGENCLHVAAGETGISDEIFIYLTNLGVSWKEKNSLGENPLHVILRFQPVISDELLNLLKTNKEIFKEKNKVGITPKDIILSDEVSIDWKNLNKNIINFVKQL
jgi:hypothetical protein